MANKPWRQRPQFRVAEVRDNILSLGKLVRKGFSFTLGPHGCSMEKDGRSVPLYLERNSLRVEAHALERASRPGYVAAGTAAADELMEGVDIKESHTLSSADPALQKYQLKWQRHLHPR